jgi:hypothetical protein
MSIFTTDKSDISDDYYQALKERMLYEGEKKLEETRSAIEEEKAEAQKVMMQRSGSSSKILIMLGVVAFVGVAAFLIVKKMKK